MLEFNDSDTWIQEMDEVCVHEWVYVSEDPKGQSWKCEKCPATQRRSLPEVTP